MTTTWNPADKSAGTTLTTGNHVATSSSGNNGARGTSSHPSGKWYFELPTIATTSSGVVGISNTTYDYGSTTPDSTNFAGIDSGGNPTGGTLSWGSPAGHAVSFAIDLDNKKYWVRYDGGNWNNDVIANQNPATNTGGFAINAAITAAFIVCRMQNSGSVTMNAGDSAFAYAAPSGFTGWDTTLPPAFSRALFVGA